MYDEAEFQAALDRPRLRGPVPEYLGANRAEPIRVLQEAELQASTRKWFDDFERKLEHVSRLGTDVTWLMDWAKRY